MDNELKRIEEDVVAACFNYYYRTFLQEQKSTSDISEESLSLARSSKPVSLRYKAWRCSVPMRNERRNSDVCVREQSNVCHVELINEHKGK
jgi:hypothetical protein